MDESITQEELLAEVAAFLRECEHTRPGPDWFTLPELLEVARIAEPKLSREGLRTRHYRAVDNGTMEKESPSRTVTYYHKL